MKRYLLSKLGQALFVVWAAYTVTFVLLYVLPSDPVELLYNPNELQNATEADKQRIREYYGFDQPVPVQYVLRLFAAVQGDFGFSIQTGRPVWESITDVLPQTLLLSVAALALAVILGFGIAIAAAHTRRAWLSDLLASVPPASVSVPVFLIGLIVLQIFSFRLGLFPPMGNSGPRSLVLPALTLAIPVSAPIAQLLVRNLQAEAQKPYVTTAITKGATLSWALRREVFKNACLPALTIAGLVFGQLLAGAVIVETVFSRSGIGRLTETAVRTQDIPLVQGIVVFAAIVFVVANLLVDVVYPLLDPRLKTRVLAS